MLLIHRVAVGALLLFTSCSLGEPAQELLSGGNLHCAIGTKACGRDCVGLEIPSNGCASSSCEPCQVPHASATCAAGTCAVDVCEFGWRDCDQDPANGCEEATESCGCHSLLFAEKNAAAWIYTEADKYDSGVVPMNFGDSDWTWEAWLKVNGDKASWSFYSNGEGREYDGISVGINSEGYMSCGVSVRPNPESSPTGTIAYGLLRPYQWQHLACERLGSSIRLYVDGILRGSATAAPVVSASNATMGRSSESNFAPVMLGPMRISRRARYGPDFEPRKRWGTDDQTVYLFLVNKGLTENKMLVDEASGKDLGMVGGGTWDGRGDTPCAEQDE